MNRDPISMFITDEQAVAPVIGFILLFAIGVIAFSSYQAFVVPQQNSEVEFTHNQDIQTDLIDLRNSMTNVQRIGSAHSTRVRLGTAYPSRLLALNPPPASGTLRTEQPESGVSINNAELVENPGDEYEYFNGSSVEFNVEDRLLETEHDTRFLLYQPRYNEFQNAPVTTYEHSLLYNRFDGRDLGITGQRVVEGNELNLVLIQADLSRQGSGSIAIDPRRSGPTENIRVQSTGGDPIELTLPTRTQGDAAIWREVFEDEPVEVEENGNDDEITLILQRDEYVLRVAAVGFSGDQPTDGFNVVRVPEDQAESGNGQESGEAVFEQLDITANDVSGGNVRSVDIDGVLDSSQEPFGDVSVEVTCNGRSPYSQGVTQDGGEFQEIDHEMEAPFDPVDVDIVVRRGGQDEWDCDSDERLTENNDLSASDFTCNNVS